MKKIFFTTLVALLCSVSSFAGTGWIFFENLPLGETYILGGDTIGQVSQGDSVTFSGYYSSDLECQISVEFFRTLGGGDLNPNYSGGWISHNVISEVLPVTGVDNGSFEFGYKFADDVNVTTQMELDSTIAFTLHCKLIPTDGSGEFGYANNQPDHTFIIEENIATIGHRLQEYKDLAVYPNPTRGLMTVEASFTQANAKVYDIAGRMVKQLSIQNNQIDVSDFECGHYLMQVEGYSPISFIKR